MANLPRILIVGGLGYIGARLASELSEDANVVVTGRTLSKERQQWSDRSNGRLEVISFDSEKKSRLPVTGSFDCVIDLVNPKSFSENLDLDQSKVQALSALTACLELVSEGRAARLIYFSSFHVYGTPRHYYAEHDAPYPTNNYGRVHLACEQHLFSNLFQIPVYILRPTHIVGVPALLDVNLKTSLFFMDLCRQAVLQKEMKVKITGKGYRDFVSMPEAVSAVKRLIKSRSEPMQLAQLLNMSSGVCLRIADVAEKIRDEAQDFLGVSIPLSFGDVEDEISQPFFVDNKKLCSLGWRSSGEWWVEIRPTLEFWDKKAKV